MYEKIWNHHKMSFGGDYNPEQWDEATWAEDMRLFKLAHIDTVTLNVFSWAALQPSENVYDFSRLDRIMELVRDNGLKVVLATSTGAHPAWMAKKYPEVLRTEFNGMKRKFGGRHNSCPNSPVYRKYSARLAEKLAERYKDYDNIVAWHISNEYGGECYCENCEKAFRVWLKDRYKTIDELNRVWNTSFWGHTFYDWDEVVLPNLLSEHFETERTMFQGISLDYRRFNSDSILACYRLEYEEVKKHTPAIPVTTNLMGFYKPLDYQKWAKYMDFVSWDSYPSNQDTPAQMALNHEMMRGLKREKPFILMEQTPSVTNWQPYNALKRPGVMRLWSYQAVAHGADSVMFFQMRRSIGACEKYHGAIIDHVGKENTRVFREAAQLGAELEQLGERTLGTVEQAKTAILFDWDNWWAIEYSAGPSCLLKYKDEVQNYYNALHAQNLATDLIDVEEDFSRYQVIFAPILYMVKPGLDEKLRQFVKNGGTLVTTFFSGYVDEHDLVTLGGYPGKLRDILGIWVEESDALPEGMKNHFTWEGSRHEVTLLCDLLHTEGAETLAVYEEDFYAGMPVLTRNRFGAGSAYYVAVRSDEDFYRTFVRNVCEECGVQPVCETPEGVEATMRYGAEKKYLFLLNHSGEEQAVKLPEGGVELLTGAAWSAGDVLQLPKTGVAILEL
ncbi:MAG: beta-galactosidase [Roseburia sp.]